MIVGLFGDMTKAAQMAADHPVVVPAERIDVLAADAVSGKPCRRTDYAGTVWYGGPPEVLDGLPIHGGSATQIKAPFWLPDSLAYAAGVDGQVRIQATGAMQAGIAHSSGGYFQILEVVAALGEDAQNAGALRVYVTVTAAASLPFGVSYRVAVTCAPDAVLPPTS
jgi:hypothetical protein